ncbi:MAG: SGNH/GDSL hydrolase family protein [Planctomycetota bacterium]|nr:SGNH/GDSL hydrolase family protein [Planctomycetota bacterium]
MLSSTVRLRVLGVVVGIVLCRLGWAAEQPPSAPAKEHAFEKDIKQYEAADQKTPPPKGAILFVGSSTIRMWKTLEKDMAPLTVMNRGFGGSQVSDVVYYADRIVIPYQPKSIVFYAGDNDLASGKQPAQILDGFKAFVEKVRTALPDVPIYFFSIKPSPSRAKLWPTAQDANKLVQEYAQKATGVTYVDVATEMLKDGQARPELFLKDMLHMNADGYAIWTRIVKAALGAKPDK